MESSQPVAELSRRERRKREVRERILSVAMARFVRQGFDDKTVTVKALSEQRRGAPQAQLLYQETTQSIEQRELAALQRKAQPAYLAATTKPSKKQRRMIHKFKQQH